MNNECTVRRRYESNGSEQSVVVLGLDRAHALYPLAFNIVVFGRLCLLEDVMAAAMAVGRDRLEGLHSFSHAQRVCRILYDRRLFFRGGATAEGLVFGRDILALSLWGNL